MTFNHFPPANVRLYKNSSAFFILILVAVWGLVIQPYLHPDLPQTQDGEYLLSRVGNYLVALNEGQLPPRWAPTFQFGLGYPVLNFLYPLLSLLSIPIVSLGYSITSSVKIIILSSYLLGSIGTFYWLRLFYSRLPSFGGALLYLTAPYQLYDLYERGNYGETLILGITPWLLYGSHKVIKTDNKFIHVMYILIWSMFLLSHTISVFLLLPFICFYLKNNFSRNELKRIILLTVVAILTCMFYWLPVLGELKYVQVANESINSAHTYFENQNKLDIFKIPGLYTSHNTNKLNDLRQVGYAHLLLMLSAVLLFFY